MTIVITGIVLAVWGGWWLLAKQRPWGRWY